ncbi:hypothetical protein Tco_0922901 [Tanacetum coccineum]|uniref:Uncharacterized protein n=1 Tax=Tanacetum coccineum TaxID=301880 RepID=A0ABQ5D119_9ASTR
MKSIVLTTYTPYPSRKIRRIHALNFTQHPRKKDTYEMDDPDITMEEYVQLESERALRNEFPAIVYNDALASKSDFSSEPTISPQHVDEIKFEK